MSDKVRRALVPITVVLVVGWFVSGCSGASSEGGAAGTSGEDGSSAVGVEISSGYVTVENRSQKPLVDTKIAIRSGSLRYAPKFQLPRLAPGEKRQVSLGDFQLPDGSKLYVNVRRPNEIFITAVDVDGKKYEQNLPWR